ncbi:hypothetical protein [Lysobacter gummosus]
MPHSPASLPTDPNFPRSSRRRSGQGPPSPPAVAVCKAGTVALPVLLQFV